jgi:hypothetical protein
MKNDPDFVIMPPGYQEITVNEWQGEILNSTCIMLQPSLAISSIPIIEVSATRYLAINDKEGKLLVRIGSDGSLWVDPSVTVDEAAAAFWAAVQRLMAMGDPTCRW